jgi:exodeoxyribonuclease VII large subunit
LAEPALASPKRANVAELTVSELSAAIKRTLEGSFGYVRLRGEISGYRGPHASGHCYFGLKDDKAKIEAVIWRGVFQSLRFRPEDGLEVIASGRVTSYPGSSKYQIVIEALEPAGIGALMALLEERKRKLAAEGLFAEERKRPLPFLPAVVGIVTSPTGAVIRDMLHGFEERFPTRVVVWPVRVQGETCAAEVARAVAGFNALPAAGGAVPRPDVIIVARGGGSLEDLWGFNEEVVVRAVAASAIPVISAVGHETDWTLIDLVADARAPTPTKAAEWAVPMHSELLEKVGDLGLRLAHSMRRRLEGERNRLTGLVRGLPRLADLLALPRQRFDAAAGRLERALLASAQAHHTRFGRVAGRLRIELVGHRLARARDRLDGLSRHALQCLGRGAQRHRTRLERLSGRLQPQMLAGRMERGEERLSVLHQRGTRAFANLIAQRRRLLEGQAQLLAALGHRSVLERGFAIVRDEAGAMVRSVAQGPPGARLEIEVADGRIAAEAVEAGAHARTPRERGAASEVVPPPAPAVEPRPRPASRGRGRSGNGDSGQGRLF